MTVSLKVNLHAGKKRQVVLGKILVFLGLLAVGLIIWPTSMGGFLQLTVVNGKSMEPTYVTGDVVLSMRQNVYKKGEVIVYHPKTLECSRCNVVHRITGGSSTAGWITQGDNNENYDGWHPKGNEIIGAVFLHLPAAPYARFLFSKWLWVGLLSIVIDIALVRFLLLAEEIMEGTKINQMKEGERNIEI